MNNVDVINTDLGTYIGTDGDVTVTNGNFNDNVDTGLTVENNGDINITNSDFNGNGQSSDGRGLIAHSAGNITLADVTASGNGGGGAELDNTFGFGNINLSGTNVFTYNGFNLYPSVGLWILTNSDAALIGVTASGNGLGYGGGAFVLSSTGNISITNSNFSDNCIYCEIGFGLFAGTSGGDITLNKVTVDRNGNDPIYGYTGPALGLGALIFNDGGNVFVTNSSFSNNCTLGDCSGGRN